MTFESFFTSRLSCRLRQRRLLTIHDQEGRYRDIVLRMADELTTVLDCGTGLLEARENALEALAALGEDSTCKRMLGIPARSPDGESGVLPPFPELQPFSSQFFEEQSAAKCLRDPLPRKGKAPNPFRFRALWWLRE